MKTDTEKKIMELEQRIRKLEAAFRVRDNRFAMWATRLDQMTQYNKRRNLGIKLLSLENKELIKLRKMIKNMPRIGYMLRTIDFKGKRAVYLSAYQIKKLEKLLKERSDGLC